MLQDKAFSSSYLKVPLTLPLFFILIKRTVHHLHCSSVWLQQSSLPCPFPRAVTFSFPFILKTLITTYTHFPDIPFYMISRELQNEKANTHEWANAKEWQTYAIVHKFYHKNRSMNMQNCNVWTLKKGETAAPHKNKMLRKWHKNVSSRSCLVCINHSVSYVQEMSKMKQFFFHLIFQNEWYVIHVVMGELLLFNNHIKIIILYRHQLIGSHTYISLPHPSPPKNI